jgi:cob(I)alamin adenosyltransferase
MPKFYTRSGDDGTSGLLGNLRVPKNHPQLEVVGTIDEASAALGLVRAFTKNDFLKEIIIIIQRDLYHMMAEIAATPENVARFRRIDQNRVTWLEEQVEGIGGQVKIPHEFIVPGDTKPGAFLDFARTVVRRAERQTSALIQNAFLDNEQILPYLNRLSTLCFLCELWETQKVKSEITLAKNKKS